MGVSKNRGTPKSSILIGCSIINHPFWGTVPVFLETPICGLCTGLLQDNFSVSSSTSVLWRVSEKPCRQGERQNHIDRNDLSFNDTSESKIWKNKLKLLLMQPPFRYYILGLDILRNCTNMVPKIHLPQKSLLQPKICREFLFVTPTGFPQLFWRGNEAVA